MDEEIDYGPCRKLYDDINKIIFDFADQYKDDETATYSVLSALTRTLAELIAISAKESELRFVVLDNLTTQIKSYFHEILRKNDK